MTRMKPTVPRNFWGALMIGAPVGLGAWALIIWAIWRLIRP